jgi:uncharacterized lipoprotein YbaY
MTRYMCVHPSHARDGEPRPVDVSDQVLIERELAPRGAVYLAYTEHVVRQVSETPLGPDRVEEITRVLTGTTSPGEAPVMLVSGRGGIDRAAGLYQADELRRAEPAAERLLHRFARPNVAAPTSDELVIVDDERDAGTEEARRRQAVMTRARSTSVPQGVFPVRLLAVRLADAPSDAVALEDAIRQTPSYGEVRSREVREPWKVVITCPEFDEEIGIQHRTTFTGSGEPEPPVVYGTPADGWDAMLEDAAAEDLVPQRALDRAERRLRLTLAGEVLLAVVLIGLSWASGGLALAARETPGWLAFAITLAAGALVFGGVALYGPREAEGNANDTLVLGRFYQSRVETLWWAGMVSIGLFSLALVTAVVPPVLLRDTPVPPAGVVFDATDRPVTATVSVSTRDLGSDDTVIVVMRQYGDAEGEATLVGRVTATGDATGTTTIRETVALDDDARYLSIQVRIEGREAGTCTPLASTGPGCTVVAVPPLGAGVVRQVVTITASSPSPSPFPSPTPAASPTPSPAASPISSPSP